MNCAKELETNDVSRIFKQQIEDFKNYLALLSSLRDPALTLSEEPWEEVRNIIAENSDIEFDPPPFHDLKDKRYTLGWIQEHNIVHFKDVISEIALKASKEAELLKMLRGVEAFWSTSSLTVSIYKDRADVFILGNNEDLIAKLDDTLLTVNNILASRFVERIVNKVDRQLKLLRYLQELLDEWMLHQRNWLYLEPILTSAYAIKTMAKEVKVFNSADTSWKRLMKMARDYP